VKAGMGTYGMSTPLVVWIRKNQQPLFYTSYVCYNLLDAAKPAVTLSRKANTDSITNIKLTVYIAHKNMRHQNQNHKQTCDESETGPKPMKVIQQTQCSKTIISSLDNSAVS